MFCSFWILASLLLLLAFSQWSEYRYWFFSSFQQKKTVSLCAQIIYKQKKKKVQLIISARLWEHVFALQILTCSDPPVKTSWATFLECHGVRSEQDTDSVHTFCSTYVSVVTELRVFDRASLLQSLSIKMWVHKTAIWNPVSNLSSGKTTTFFLKSWNVPEAFRFCSFSHIEQTHVAVGAVLHEWVWSLFFYFVFLLLLNSWQTAEKSC